jgi:hypothetical protein
MTADEELDLLRRSLNSDSGNWESGIRLLLALCMQQAEETLNTTFLRGDEGKLKHDKDKDGS